MLKLANKPRETSGGGRGGGATWDRVARYGDGVRAWARQGTEPFIRGRGRGRLREGNGEGEGREEEKRR